VGKVTAPQFLQISAVDSQFCMQNQHSFGAKASSYKSRRGSAIALTEEAGWRVSM
jgi:hypothetical protein